MPNISPNIIERLDQDWGNDIATGLPFGGGEVQRFIKSYLSKIAVASFFDSNKSTMYWFDSEAKKQAFINDTSQTSLALFSTKLDFNSDLFRVFLTNNNGTNIINTATNQETVELSLDFEVQTKSITDSIWRGTTSGVNVTADIDVGATGNFSPIHGVKHYNPGETYTLNARPYIESGANRIRVSFVDEDDASVMASFTYTINMSTMYIETINNRWYRPLIEDGNAADYQLGGFKIVGNLYKTLHIDIYSGTAAVKNIVYDRLGTDSFNQFYYTRALGLDLSDLPTGVYLVSAYLTSGTGLEQITTAPVNYNIMYIAAGESANTQLVCINDVSENVYNYADSTMFHYSIYNKGQSTGSPTAVLKELTQGTPIIIEGPRLDNVETSTDNTYVISLMWLTQETFELRVQADLTFGNTQVATSVVDNRFTFPPTGGYDFYLNSPSGNNSDSHREKLLNLANNTYLNPSWTRMCWINNIDGWTYDDTSRKGLYIPARSRMVLPSSEFQFLATPSVGLTFEICYKVSNSSDYNETVISLMGNENLNGGFTGIRIRPTNITVHSSSGINGDNDVLLGTNLTEGEIIHFVLTLYPNYEGTGNNLVTGYINGCKNFQFSYSSLDTWDVTSPLIIGGDKSDVMVYFIRSYRTMVLEESRVMANYLNSIVAEREEDTVIERKTTSEFLKSVLDNQERNIDYKAVKNSNYNYFVIEMMNDQPIPSIANGWTADVHGASNLEMHFGEHPEWDWKIENTYIEGQGTTSMRYYRWNIKWRIDKNADKVADVSYLAGTSLVNGEKTYTWEDPVTASTIKFDGPTLHPEVSRITAKINFASSMQSHKMGATWAYTELHNAVGLSNEAQELASPKPVVSVYQYPAYGFAKIGNTYSFIGLFTIGPDKGDKGTFGFGLSDVKSSLISMEGSDHFHSIVMFSHPWGESASYSLSDEFLNLTNYAGTKRGGWEVGECYNIKTDSAGAEAAINQKLVEEFKPAYDVVFNNSTMIFGIPSTEYGADAAETLAYIQNNKDTFRGLIREGNRLANRYYQFWIDGEYKLYYYDETDDTPSYKVSANLGTPQGSTIEEKNEWFKAQRRNSFKANAEKYWDIQDSIYHYAFMIIIGAVDNFGKNTYPYKMASLGTNNTIGGTWKWRQDDLDSILGINNAGADTVKYWSEYTDTSAPGISVYGGSPSVFWTLIHECYMEDYSSIADSSTQRGIRSMGKDILSEMTTKSGAGSVLEGVVRYFKLRFWDKAQEYFPQSAYNVDAKFKYEAAWVAGANQQAPPLPQSLGNHYSAEYFWVYNRAIYLMSLFRAGPFGNERDESLGQVTFRSASGGSTEETSPIELVPFSTIYPVLLFGQTPVVGSRMEAGEPYMFTGLPSDGQTVITLNGSNLYTYFGDWSTLNIDTTLTPVLPVTGKKLVTFKIGDEDSSNVSTNISGISFSNVPCLEKIDARNATSINGTLDLSSLKRLKEAYLEGTQLAAVSLADGQKIEVLHYPDTINSIVLRNHKFLTDENLVLPSSLDNILTLQVYGCPNQNAFNLLKSIYNTSGNSLRFINIQQDDLQEESADFISMLVGLVEGKNIDGDDVDYGGVIDGVGSPTSNPIIEGNVQMTAGYYADDLDKLDIANIEDYGTGLKKVLITNFGALNLIYNPALEYIRFADPEVLSVCLSNNWGDGIGVLYSAAAALSTIGVAFRGNTEITSFDELRYFGVSEITGGNVNTMGAFASCSNLKSIILPDTVTRIGAWSFTYCSELESVVFGSGVQSIGTQAFHAANKLSYIDLPASVTSISAHAFSTNYNGHIDRTVIVRSSTAPELGNNAFDRYIGGVNSLNNKLKIYVPLGYGEYYKGESGWSRYADYIFELDENGNIPE